ncbi:uncharacterized protein LOC108088761 [Drosophila ficusphila]|uniref:uncharacterized protein LOC108088761 n=1 Tax=Drosophila ficusphila TaxID=30025 RepID=UPI0007E622DB|nr:uncharacterized protein LOC108088761 [Drosophila ficusphila]
MKLFVVALTACLVAFAAAQSADSNAALEPSAEYLPPVGEAEAAALSEDGYRYKTVRRLKLRHRREVPSQEYLPPVLSAPSQEYLPPVDAAAIGDTKVADDGYRYKTVRRLKLRRHRREVADETAPNGEYLPPAEAATAAAAPVAAEAEPKAAADEGTELASDGYRYKTVRRLRFRARH